MVIAQAQAILAAASANPNALGREFYLNGEKQTAVKRLLTQKESSLFDQSGLGIEGLRITIVKSQIEYTPEVGMQMDVDGHAYKLTAVDSLGLSWRMILTRYRS